MKKAIIVDIDNTILDLRKISDKYYKDPMNNEDWILFESKFSEAYPIYPTINLINYYIDLNYHILFITARRNKPHVRRATLNHIRSLLNKKDEFTLLMASANDNRDDDVVKLELYKTKVEEHYQIEFALEDREDVRNMWLSQNILVLQVFQP